MTRIIVIFLVVCVLNLSAYGQRIAGLGDSITHGFGQTSWTALAGGYLPGWEFINYGEPGATANRNGNIPISSQGVYWDALGSGANAIVIMLGTNDGKWENWVSREYFEGEMRWLIDQAANAIPSAVIYVATPIPALSNSFGIDENLVNGEVSRGVRNVAGYRGSVLIDLNAVFFDGGNYSTDGIHPNWDGQNRIANIVANAVSNGGVPINNREPVAPPQPEQPEGIGKGQFSTSEEAFNEHYYLTRYGGELGRSGWADPFRHYINQGGRNGFDPSPDFDSSAYLDANGDIASSELNPLDHWIYFGQFEDFRRTFAVVDYNYDPNASIQNPFLSSEPGGSPEEAPAGLARSAESLGGGWYQLPGFGEFNADAAPWLYHPQLGWVWDATGGNTNEMWLYSPGLDGFLWTNTGQFPVYYDINRGGWFSLESNGGTNFVYNFGNDRWGRSPFL